MVRRERFVSSCNKESKKVNQNPASNTVWEQQLDWFKDSSQSRFLDTIDGEPMEFELNIFPRIHDIAARPRSPEVHEQNGRGHSGGFHTAKF